MLTFPPQFDPSMPNLALPCLTAFLRDRGHEVIQRDLNVESFDILLSRRELARAAAKMQANYNSLLFLGGNAGELDRLLKKRDYLCDAVEDAKRLIRGSRDFYDYSRYLVAQKVVADSLQLISLAYFGSQLSWEGYTMFYSPLSAEQVLKAVQSPDFNLYHEFFARYTIPDIAKLEPQVLGISLATDNQVIPGLTLAYLVRQAFPDIHIVIGGVYCTILRNKLPQKPELFALFDSVVVYEGEVALARLLDCLEYHQDLRNVPNLIYRDGSEIIVNEVQGIKNLDTLPAPTFAGLPLELYFSPEPVLPVYTSRGCYWGKCAFCNLGEASHRQYSTRGPAIVIAEIENLNRQYDCRFFILIDEAIPPDYLNQLADLILERELKIKWGSHARLEPELTPDLCGKLAKSGCRAFSFGLESACRRVLALIDKGTDPVVMQAVLAGSHAAGIINEISLFIGFPTETPEEAKSTMKFIFDNLEYISAISFGNFHLIDDSNAYVHPGAYDIEAVLPIPGYDLSPEHHYRVKSGLTLQESWAAARLFAGILQDLGFIALKNTHLVIMADHYQTNDLLWLTTTPEEKRPGAKPFKAERLRKARQKAANGFNDPAFLESSGPDNPGGRGKS